MNKWNSQYWTDLAERVASSALGGVLTMLGLAWSDLLSTSPEAWGTVVGIPAATSLVKGLLMNLKSDTPSASVVGITSNQSA